MSASAFTVRTKQVVAILLAAAIAACSASDAAAQQRQPFRIDEPVVERLPETTTIDRRPIVQTAVAPKKDLQFAPWRQPSSPMPSDVPQPISNSADATKSNVVQLRGLAPSTLLKRLPPATADQPITSSTVVQRATFEADLDVRICRYCGERRRRDETGAGCNCAHSLGVGEFTDKVQTRVAIAAHETPKGPGMTELQVALTGFVPWWEKEIGKPQRIDSQLMPVTLDDMILQAVQYSHFIQAQSNLPLMSEEAILEAAAEFDISAFTESRYTRTSEPIGNRLTAGPGRTRFRDKNWSYEGGIRKKTYNGAALEVGQRYGYQRNNSDFLNPNPQSTAQLALRFSQPLLRGSGKVYNSSLIMLAQFDKNIAWDKFSRELQNHLVEVSSAYWELYLQRAILLQRERHFDRASTILKELETRADIDAARSQIVRAQSAVAARQSDLARAHAAVRNAQVRLRALVNMPALQDTAIELVPSERPNPQFIDVSMQDALVTALENRPEIDESMQQLRSAKLQVSVSQHELLPTLDLVTETYVSGLQPGSSVGQSWKDQFQIGEPSYTVGIEMEVPLHNRAAKARNRRKKLQLQWIVSRYKDTLENLTAEVEIVVRDVHTAYEEMIGKYHAMQATLAELNYLTDRWHLLPGDDRSSSFLLEDILDIQNRLVGHEFELARAQVAYTQSLIELKRATGTLLESEQVSAMKFCEGGVPQLQLSKTPQDDFTKPVETAFESTIGERAESDLKLIEPVVAEPIIRQPITSPPTIEELPRGGFEME